MPGRFHPEWVADLTRISHQLAIEMIERVAQWLPERDFCVVTDGAYAPLIRYCLPRTIVVSRMRRNAAIYEPPPPRTGMRGRPRKKGRRLPSLPELANSVTGWTRETVSIRGRAEQRDLWAREVLWYLACPDRTVLLVIVRDPQGLEPDDYFVTTDTTAQPAQVASAYADRWAIVMSSIAVSTRLVSHRGWASGWWLCLIPELAAVQPTPSRPPSPLCGSDSEVRQLVAVT